MWQSPTNKHACSSFYNLIEVYLTASGWMHTCSLFAYWVIFVVCWFELAWAVGSRWTYRKGIELASVHPDLETWISLRPAGQSRLNFIWSIIGFKSRFIDYLVLFSIGTIAEGAPVIPISAQLKYNIDVVCEYITKKIPVPLRDFSSEPRLIGM